MPRNVLQPPTLSLPPRLPSSALLFPPRCHSPGSIPLLLRAAATPLQPPLRLSPVVAVFDRNSISTGPPLSPTYLKSPSSISFSTSPTKPPPPPFGRPSAPRERKPPAAFRAINYVAQLFTGISRRHCLSDYPAPPVPTGRYPAKRDVNMKTGDFKWPA